MQRCGIPVVWGLDKKYVLQAFVVMHSILKNSEQNYHFFILTADEIKDDIEEFKDILRRQYSNFELSVKMVDIEHFASARIYNGHLSKAAYFRLLIPEVMLEYDKCIYLDCDLIVHGDLKELYEIDLKDYYLAGVKDCHVIEDTLFELKHQQILGIPSRDKYINSGVMVMNLDIMRKNKLVKCFLEQLKEENWFEDQDVLNRCCYPRIKILPLKYNLFHFYLGNHIKFLYDLPYDRQEFEFDHNHPFILHMGADFKPWNRFSVKGSKEWWQLAKIFSMSESYQNYQQKCQKAKSYDETKALLNRARKEKYIVIWGGGRNGKRLCDLFLEYRLENVVAIVDNNAELWGKEYRGISVKSLASVMEAYHNVFWIISCRFAYDQIVGQLENMGIDKKDIFYYRNRYEDRMYLLSLAEEEYRNEIDKIADLEYIRLIPYRRERRRYIFDIIQKTSVYAKEYAYLEERYGFQYWLNMLTQETENENNCYNGLPE